MRKTLLALLWFPVSITFLVINLAMLAAMPRWQTPAIPLSAVPANEVGFAATSGTPTVLAAEVIAGDARTVLLQKFLQENNSPLTPYADLLVKQADSKGFDFRLLPSIAMCESNLGKKVPLKSGFNPFGIAVYTGTNKGKNFDSWEQAITWVSDYIAQTYYSRGATSLTDIEKNWAPPSAQGSHTWSNCVQFFQESIL